MSFNAKNYLRTIAPSFLVLIMMAYGMATHNVWIQFGGVFLVLGVQMGFQMYKGVKSGPALEANVREAVKAKRMRALMYMSEQDVRSAQLAGGSGGQRSEGMKMIGMLVVPLGIFFGTTYLVGHFWPETPPWQSYVAAFLLSMPASAVFTARSGMPGAAPRTTPSSYLVTERGIVFDQMGRSFIVRFPLARAEKGKDGSSVEVEGVKESDMIPFRLKLHTDKADELVRLLSPRVKADSKGD